MSQPAKGEIWWGEMPDEKGRPYLVMTRDEGIPVLRKILVAPISRTLRGIPTEVPLGITEGLPVECAASMDAMLAFPKSMLVRKLGGLSGARSHEVCDALRAATDC